MKKVICFFIIILIVCATVVLICPKGNATSAADSPADTPQSGTSATPSAANPEAAPVTTSQPKLMVEKYALDRDYLQAGESATVKITIRNTSSEQDVKNIKVSFWEESAEILPAGTGAVYYKQIVKGGSCVWSLGLTATTAAQSQPHPATVTMEYEDSSSAPCSATDRIILQVRQPVRLSYEEPAFPIRVTEGDTPTLSITLHNLGKSAVNNTLLQFEIAGLSSGGSILVGSIPPGETKTGTASFKVKSEPLGKVTGKLLLSYEDEYGEHYEQEIPLSTTIEEKKEAPLPQNSDAAQDASTQQRRLILAVAGAIFIALICYFAIKWRKEKKEREIDEMRL